MKTNRKPNVSVITNLENAIAIAVMSGDKKSEAKFTKALESSRKRPERNWNEALHLMETDKTGIGDARRGERLVPEGFARRLESERDEARNGLREAWLILDSIDDDRADEWQNKWAHVFGHNVRRHVRLEREAWKPLHERRC